MRPTNKSRSRNKGNRRLNGNSVNKVFESSGPEGKVRGNAQQIIDKYEALARDAFLAGDRVAGENFKQHCEHYVRVLSEVKASLEQRASGNPQTPFASNPGGANVSQDDLAKTVIPESREVPGSGTRDASTDTGG